MKKTKECSMICSGLTGFYLISMVLAGCTASVQKKVPVIPRVNGELQVITIPYEELEDYDLSGLTDEELHYIFIGITPDDDETGNLSEGSMDDNSFIPIPVEPW